MSVMHLSHDHCLLTVKITSSFCDHAIFLTIMHSMLPIFGPYIDHGIVHVFGMCQMTIMVISLTEKGRRQPLVSGQ